VYSLLMSVIGERTHSCNTLPMSWWGIRYRRGWITKQEERERWLVSGYRAVTHHGR
jgi:hypothetical protein